MWVQQSGDIISVTPLQKASQITLIYCYLLPELGPDYLNKEGKNVLITNQASSGGAGKVICLVLKPQAHASQINNPHRAPPHVTQTSKGRRTEEGRETRGEPDPPLDAFSQSGRDEGSSSAALSPLLNMISCYDMVAGDVSHALIRHFLLQPAGLLAVVLAG